MRPQARQAPRCWLLLPPLPSGLPAAVGTPCPYPGPETNPKSAPSPANPRVRHRIPHQSDVQQPVEEIAQTPRLLQPDFPANSEARGLPQVLLPQNPQVPWKFNFGRPAGLCLATPGVPLVAGHTLPPLTPSPTSVFACSGPSPGPAAPWMRAWDWGAPGQSQARLPQAMPPCSCP